MNNNYELNEEGGVRKLGLERNASFETPKKKTHVRTGSDYWTEVAKTTPYIDRSTGGSLMVTDKESCCFGGGSNSTPALFSRPIHRHQNIHIRYSVREGKRKHKIARFYGSDNDAGCLRIVEPLLPSSRSSLAAVWSGALNQVKTKPNRKPSSWEESVSAERRRSAAGPLTSLHVDTKDLRYLFQHPYLRQFTTLLVIFCNFLLFAEDPISHSHTESVVPMVGNVFSFVCTKYPPDWRWSLVKVLMWVLAILSGLVIGKLVLHSIIFGKYLRLKMFRDEQGSWIAMFLTVILSLYIFSHIYNLILHIFYNKPRYHIDSRMGLSNSAVMKGAACGTWIGDLVTWLCVTDVMLQDSLYPNWAPKLRAAWVSTNLPRVLLFWIISGLATAFVVTLIVSDLISWDTLNRDFVASTELSRAFLASFILVLDLVIMMQDWDFPHFTTTVHINLPGFSVSTLEWKYAELTLTGKWFSYGIIFMVMMLDLNMWKNQIFYTPDKFGQYVGPNNKIHTVQDQTILQTENVSLWTWESRSKINETTKLPYYYEDMKMNSRYMGYPLIMKCTAFIPSIFTLSLFIYLIYLYGRFPHAKRDDRQCNTELVTEEGVKDDS
ncbi:transmembrane protein 117 isoform X1 [Halyomorpha halys]|uniref:transmembrane protein 117 isoform X1 n=1 Tax=Halyomorpha halys TaxID=286706 RepID=UPI0006D4CF7F